MAELGGVIYIMYVVTLPGNPCGDDMLTCRQVS
jgi:hypothetical protein